MDPVDDNVIPTTPIPPSNRSTREYELTPREVRFVVKCIEYGDAGKAYRETIARLPLSNKASSENASKLIRNRKPIREYMRRLVDQAAESAGVTTYMVIARAAAVAFADWSRIYDAKGELLPFSQWPKGYKALVSFETEITFAYVKNKKTGRRKRVRSGCKTKIKTPNSGEALRTLAQILKMIGNNPVDPNAEKFKPMTISGEAKWENV